MSRQFTKDPWMEHAKQVIFADDAVNVTLEAKNKDLLKFGRNTAVSTAATGYTIWATGADNAHETYVAANTNSIDSISTSTVADTSISFTVEGHTEAGGNKTFVTQTATTDAASGRTRVALSTPLNRVTRAYNSGAVEATGPVFFYENTALTSGKPTDTTKIHLTIPAAMTQSKKASTSLSSVDYWVVTSFFADVLTKTGTVIADVSLQIRLSGKLFRTRATLSSTNSMRGVFEFKPYLIIPPNSDVRLVAVGSASSDVAGGIEGALLKAA